MSVESTTVNVSNTPAIYPLSGYTRLDEGYISIVDYQSGFLTGSEPKESKDKAGYKRMYYNMMVNGIRLKSSRVAFLPSMVQLHESQYGVKLRVKLNPGSHLDAKIGKEEYDTMMNKCDKLCDDFWNLNFTHRKTFGFQKQCEDMEKFKMMAPFQCSLYRPERNGEKAAFYYLDCSLPDDRYAKEGNRVVDIFKRALGLARDEHGQIKKDKKGNTEILYEKYDHTRLSEAQGYQALASVTVEFHNSFFNGKTWSSGCTLSSCIILKERKINHFDSTKNPVLSLYYKNNLDEEYTPVVPTTSTAPTTDFGKATNMPGFKPSDTEMSENTGATQLINSGEGNTNLTAMSSVEL